LASQQKDPIKRLSNPIGKMRKEVKINDECGGGGNLINNRIILFFPFVFR
jgi:hypothetical protein